jgi:hypothetical protein
MKRLRSPTFSTPYKIDLRLKEKVGDLGRKKFLFYENGLLNALKNVTVANVNKVTLEWGLRLGGRWVFLLCWRE